MRILTKMECDNGRMRIRYGLEDSDRHIIHNLFALTKDGHAVVARISDKSSPAVCTEAGFELMRIANDVAEVEFILRIGVCVIDFADGVMTVECHPSNVLEFSRALDDGRQM